MQQTNILKHVPHLDQCLCPDAGAQGAHCENGCHGGDAQKLQEVAPPKTAGNSTQSKTAASVVSPRPAMSSLEVSLDPGDGCSAILEARRERAASNLAQLPLSSMTNVIG